MANRKRKITETDVGDLIFYKWKGFDAIRLKGNTGKQAPIAKKQAKILGKASALSARLRAAFEPLMPPPINRDILNRFNNAIQQWLRLDEVSNTGPFDNIPFISAFNFYGSPNVIEYLSHFSINRTSAGTLELHITELDPSGYPGILSSNGNVHLYIIVASVNMQNPSDTKSAELKVDIPIAGTIFLAQDLLLPLQTSPGCLTVVAFASNGMNVSIAGAMYN